jgi:hypothetical protein
MLMSPLTVEGSTSGNSMAEPAAGSLVGSTGAAVGSTGAAVGSTGAAVGVAAGAQAARTMLKAVKTSKAVKERRIFSILLNVIKFFIPFHYTLTPLRAQECFVNIL